MVTPVTISVVLMFVLTVGSSGVDKRVLLHSDEDISFELNNIKALLASQNQSIQALTAQVSSKDADIAQLQSRMSTMDSDIAQLQSQMSTKDSDIAQLQSRMSTKDSDIAQLQSQMTQLNNSKVSEIAQLQLQMSTKESDIAQLRSDIVQLKNNGGKSSYIRWGKTTCPGNGSTLVYSGYMAGSDHDQTGTGANYLCLADKPRTDYVDSAHGYGGVRGMEYQFSSHTAAQTAVIFGSNIYNDDAPCAVCETSRATNIMIPGTNTCYGGWTKEYTGYLVSNFYGAKHASEYVCLDRRPDVIPGSQVNDDHGILYIAEVDCGSSSLCPPYAQGHELTCVVCSK